MLGCSKSDCVIVGDRIDTDILFAKNCGIKSYLVLEKNEYQNDTDNAPSFTFNNLLEVIQKEENREKKSQK